MPIDDIINETTPVREVAQQQRRQQAQQPPAPAQTATSSFENVVQLEKTDIQMWLDVAKVALLLAIYFKL